MAIKHPENGTNLLSIAGATGGKPKPDTSVDSGNRLSPAAKDIPARKADCQPSRSFGLQRAFLTRNCGNFSVEQRMHRRSPFRLPTQTYGFIIF